MPQRGNCPHQKQWACGDPHAGNSDNCTNNLMTYGFNLEYISPMQVGKSNRHVATSFVSRYIKENISTVPFHFTQDAEIDHDLVLYSDVYIDAGKTVTFQKPTPYYPPKFALPKQSILEISGKLEI